MLRAGRGRGYLFGTSGTESISPCQAAVGACAPVAACWRARAADRELRPPSCVCGVCMKTAGLLLLLVGCSTTPPGRHAVSASVTMPTQAAAHAPATRRPAEHAAREESVLDMPAEPFSGAWGNEPQAQLELRPDQPRHAWVDAHACAAPDGEDRTEGGYGALVGTLFDFGRDVQVLATLRKHADYRYAPEGLGLVRRSGGGYALRTIQIASGKWRDLTTRVRHAGSDTAPEAVLAEVAATRVIRERPVDAATARVILDLWGGLIARAQVVQEVNPMRFVIHATAFTWEAGGTRALAWSPVAGSVLGDAILAAQHLQRVVEGTSTDEVAELQVARDLMRESLERTRKKEPCLLHFDL